MIDVLQNVSWRVRKCLQNGPFLGKRHTQNLQDCVEAQVQIEPLFDDRHQDVSAHSNPDLGLQSVGACSHECLDSQVLLDPFEEKLDVPAVAIQIGDRLRWEHKIVGQEDQSLLGLRIEKPDSTQTVRVSLLSN